MNQSSIALCGGKAYSVILTRLKQWRHLGNVLHDMQWFFCFALCRHYNII